MFSPITAATTKGYLCEVKDVLTNLVMVNILQYIQISSYHIVHLKLTQGYMSIMSQ